MAQRAQPITIVQTIGMLGAAAVVPAAVRAIGKKNAYIIGGAATVGALGVALTRVGISDRRDRLLRT